MKHVSSGLRVGLAMTLCAAVLVPSALADNGKKPPEAAPGNSANAPGHNKDPDAPPPQTAAPESEPPAPTPAPTPPPSAPAEGAPAPAGTPPAKKAEPQAPAVAPPAPTAVEQPEQPKKPKKAEANRRPVGAGKPSTPSSDASAHRKVLICHATGSATNPYVLISVSVNAWNGGHGHGGHADDVFVDWSWPGDPRQKDDALCGSTGPVEPPATTASTVGSTAASSSAPGDPEPRRAPGVDDPSTPGQAAPERRPAVMAPPATAVQRAVVAASGQLAGVAVRGTLPFTGVPLWGVGLIGLTLLALGLDLRRRTALRA